MASALIIGIGSSGLHIIEEAQQFYYELTGKNKPDGVEYFYIETDRRQMSKNTALGESAIDRVFISLRNNQATINNLKNSGNAYASWIPSSTTVLNNEEGAGGMSAYGRLALWGNYNEVRQYIQNKYNKINGSDDTMIFIVGTLTGGTGSGLCVDIPYIVRSVTQNNNIYGLFLTPDRNSINDATKRPLFINYFNSIASITKYTKSQNTFKIEWPGSGEYTDIRPPYSQVQLISQDFDNANAPISDINGLYRIGGLALMTRLLGLDKTDINNKPIDTFSAMYGRRMVDAKSNISDDFKFSSFGISMIQYPKSQIEELYAIELAQDVINSWLDTDNYRDNTGKIITISSYEVRLNIETVKQFDEDLEACFKMLDGKNSSDGNSFRQSISTIASNIIEKNIAGKPTNNAYLLDIFRNNNSDNHYKSLANYNIDIRDFLIKSLHERLIKFLDEFQNIELCKLKILSLIDTIDSIIMYWREKLQITSDVAEWNRILEKQIKEIFASTSTYYICKQKKNFIEEQLYNIFTLSKMHIIIEVLNTLKESLNQPSSYLKSNSTHIELPSIKRLNEFRKNLSNAIVNETSSPSFSRRKTEIESDLKNNTNQIIRLFEFGSLNQDLSQARAAYGKGAKKITFKDFTKNTNIWHYLLLTKDTIYKDFTKGGVEFVRQNKIVSDINIVNLISKITPTDSQYPKIKNFTTGTQANIVANLPAMIHLDRSIHQFQPYSCLKTIILTSDINGLRPLLHYQATNTDEAVELPELQNAIIYQQEYGYMGAVNVNAFQPMLHIGYNKTIVTNVLKPEIEREGDGFYEKRVPYLSKIEFDNTQKEILK